MSRVSPTAVSAALSVLSLTLGPQAPRVHAQEQGPPSIVLIVTDDERWDTLTQLATVNSELVQKGIQFTDSFVSSPLCVPGRAGILTGQYPHHNDMWRNRPPHGGFQSFVDGQSLAVWLKSANYTTSLIGKYFNGYPPGATYVPPGWDNWLAFVGDSGYYSYYLNRNGVVEYHGNEVADYSTDFLGHEAAKFIRDTAGPIFLEFTPKAPHEPATPAERHKNKYPHLPPFRPESYNEDDVSDKPTWLQNVPQLSPADMIDLDNFRRDQLRTLLAVDEAIAEILTALDETGRLGRDSNTMIVFTSDNGYSWGEHRWTKKIVPYEEDIRVPLVIRYDPLTQVARQENHAVMNIDIAPTLLELAGTAPPSDFIFDGMSLMPLIRGESPPWRTEFIVELLTDEYPISVPTYCAVRRTTTSSSGGRPDFYARYAPSGDEELYDLAADPFQIVSKVTDPLYASRLATMREMWEELCPPPPEP